MPFPFVLPTTSSFSFSSCFASDSHPSLPLSASTYRGVVRDTLKQHKGLPAASKASSLGSVISSLEAYVPYLLAIDGGLCSRPVPVAGPPGGGGGGSTSTGELVDVILKTTPCMAWRPTICAELVPGRERSRRVRAASLEHEIGFALSALAAARVLAARAALQPLYSTTTEFLGARERTAAVTAATRELLAAASVYEYLVARGEQPDVVGPPPSADIAPAALRALACLALAEATLLAVLKDDPYPAAVAQDRNRNDREWMFRSPEIPKVRAHLFARLCLAASEHAARASSLCQSLGSESGSGRISPALLRYVEDLRRTSRAKACRFFGIDAELGGETADGIAWMRAGLQELGAQAKDAKKGGLSLSRLKKDFEERREDRRVDKETAWGADAGRLEEIRILEMLDAKWNKINDTMNTRPIPPVNSLLAKMPSGRDIHTIKPYQPPFLDRDVLESMRAPPDGDDEFGDEASSEDDDGSRPLAPIGAFPGSAAEYGRSSTPGSSYY